METTQVKEEIVRLIQSLPEDATVEDAIERLYFFAKIERGSNTRKPVIRPLMLRSSQGS
jgi:hypothetical protein